MATDVQQEPPQQQSVPTLVSGLIGDAQTLMNQQLALFRTEIKQDMTRTFQAATTMGIGLGVATLGGIVLAFAVAHLLHWAFADRMPLWVAYLVIGAAFSILGVVLFMGGKKQLESFNPLPDKSTEALKENVQWLTNTQK